MKNYIALIGITIFLISVFLSGCNQISDNFTPEKNKFIGTWQNTTGNDTTTIILNADGSCSFSTFTGVWDVKNKTLVMEVPEKYLIYTFYYTFSNNNNILTLSSAVTTSSTVNFTRQ